MASLEHVLMTSTCDRWLVFIYFSSSVGASPVGLVLTGPFFGGDNNIHYYQSIKKLMQVTQLHP